MYAIRINGHTVTTDNPGDVLALTSACNHANGEAKPVATTVAKKPRKKRARKLSARGTGGASAVKKAWALAKFYAENKTGLKLTVREARSALSSNSNLKEKWESKLARQTVLQA